MAIPVYSDDDQTDSCGRYFYAAKSCAASVSASVQTVASSKPPTAAAAAVQPVSPAKPTTTTTSTTSTTAAVGGQQEVSPRTAKIVQYYIDTQQHRIDEAQLVALKAWRTKYLKSLHPEQPPAAKQPKH